MEIEYKRKLGSTVPFGWELVENSKDLLRSIPEQHELLEKAKQHAKQHTMLPRRRPPGSGHWSLAAASSPRPTLPFGACMPYGLFLASLASHPVR